MPLPNADNTRTPSHRKFSRQSKLRHESSQAKEPPRPPTQDDYDTPAFVQEYGFRSHPLQPPPVNAPESQPSLKPEASSPHSAITRTPCPPPNAPRGPRSMRQLVPSRGGRRKSRPYPGLQIEGLPKPPQNQYQQAMAYVDGIVRKTTDTLLMLPTDMGARQDIPEDLRGNKPVSTLTHSKIAPPSPILQSLQSNREGGYFSITPGLRDAERQQGMMSRHTSQAAPSERAVESQEFYDKDNLARTPGEQEIVEAMQGLKIFSGLRPGSRQSPLSLFEASVPLKKRHVNNPACATLATTDTQAYRETSIASVAESSNTHRETLCPQEVADFDQAALGKVAYDDEITRHITDKTTPPAALPESTPEQNVPQDTVQVVKSATKVTDKNGSFEDLSLVSPTSDSSASSVESARSDDDFEKVNAEIYETRRNGQPSAWTNWI